MTDDEAAAGSEMIGGITTNYLRRVEREKLFPPPPNHLSPER
jgi:hypothetical protein